ncbi:MAG: type II toxin-antitoxin system VapC family toxin [Nitrospirae bacterium YQR-1]
MNFLFDTNIVAFLYDKNSKNHTKIYNQFSALKDEDNLFVSVLTIYEMQYSILNGEPTLQKFFRASLKALEEHFQILPVNKNGAYFYGELKSFLRKNKKINRENIKKHNIDIILASTARTENCVLVSADKIYDSCREIWKNFKFQNWLD